MWNVEYLVPNVVHMWEGEEFEFSSCINLLGYMPCNA